jgi:hypothetical protein
MNLYLLVQSSKQCYADSTLAVAANTEDEGRTLAGAWDPRSMSIAVLARNGGAGIGPGILFFTDLHGVSEPAASRTRLEEPAAQDLQVYLAMQSSPACQVARLWVIAAGSEDAARASIGMPWNPDVMSLAYLTALPLTQIEPAILFETGDWA